MPAKGVVYVRKKLEVKIGDRYGRLEIIEECESFTKTRFFLCKCDCGEEKKVLLADLRRGHTKSCGCFRKEKLSSLYTTHGCLPKKLYHIWNKMKDRCLKPNNDRYVYYGERGIKICAEWMDFTLFRSWALQNGYKEGLSIERDDYDANYGPSNCRWIPKSEQPLNSRHNRTFTFNGKTQCLTLWAKELGLSTYIIYQRLSKGWDVDRIFRTPHILYARH